ncbi:MFS transporter [Streptomyces lavenduligriseus]|uniref:MFS transporter n=1 Tax=Streptomyces lavenduligriseus TaxID=67315 RepID=A0ABT0NYU2_9ACTN|nr:MFS transporter [Streptomyces lavenduligriseus]MCL3996645.1 MFS transporter [Streptomyces lavenduligriseus]
MAQPTSPDRRIRKRTTRLSGYRRLFALPGAGAFTAGNLLARLPMGMFSVSAVVMIAGSRGSYALAGAVTATGLAATAVAGPFVARLVDRHGQARIALPATVVSVLGSLALLLCVRHDASDWTLFAAYAATATTPNTGGLSRARWAHLLRDDPGALHTANAFEQAADELCFMLGPVLASFLTGTFFPEAGTLTGAVLLLAGMLLFTAQRATEPPPTARSQAPSPLRSPGIPALLVCFTATGAVFGSMEVVTIAYADAQGHRAAAGAVLALQAAGSCAAGLAYGAYGTSGPAGPRLVRCLAAMAALMTLPWAAAGTGSLVVLAGALLVAGMATAPTMVTAMALVQRRTPADRLNEGMSLMVTGLLAGIACGSATGGWAAERLSPVTAFAVPAAAAVLALLVGGAGGREGAWRRPRHQG